MPFSTTILILIFKNHYSPRSTQSTQRGFFIKKFLILCDRCALRGEKNVTKIKPELNDFSQLRLELPEKKRES